MIVDDRESFANRERFPEADEVYAAEYEAVFPNLSVNESSYLIIVTRGHKDDLRVLRLAAAAPARYVAMIGSKKKVIELVKELENEGVPRDALDRLHAPMGLDIGAITPEEIAVAVVAEMIAVRRNAPSNWRELSQVHLSSQDGQGGAQVSLAGLILAAGESRRMGSPKALLEFDGETFLDRLILTLGGACSPVIVVLGCEPQRIRAGLALCRTGDVRHQPGLPARAVELLAARPGRRPARSGGRDVHARGLPGSAAVHNRTHRPAFPNAPAG